MKRPIGIHSVSSRWCDGVSSGAFLRRGLPRLRNGQQALRSSPLSLLAAARFAPLKKSFSICASISLAVLVCFIVMNWFCVQRYTFSFESTINYEILIQITLPFQTFVVLLALVMDKEAFEKHKAFAGHCCRSLWLCYWHLLRLHYSAVAVGYFILRNHLTNIDN